MLANTSRGSKTLGETHGEDGARYHAFSVVYKCALGEATKKKSSIYSLPLCKPLQGRFPAGWYPGIGRGGKSVYTAFWVAQGAGMKSRGGKAGGGDFAQAKYYPFTP